MLQDSPKTACRITSEPNAPSPHIEVERLNKFRHYVCLSQDIAILAGNGQ